MADPGHFERREPDMAEPASAGEERESPMPQEGQGARFGLECLSQPHRSSDAEVQPEPSIQSRPKPRLRSRRWRGGALSVAILLGLVGSLGWIANVYRQIHRYATHDESRPADAIAVFGAAEYDGRPSPVLRARLDHALELYREKLAPLIVTLGGGDPSERHSEGGVGEDYLLAHGVPERAILAETQSSNTRESAERLAVIAHANQLTRILVVSDGTHLFRIHVLCAAMGLTVYTSPRREGKSLPLKARAARVMHEIVSYTAFRLHMH